MDALRGSRKPRILVVDDDEDTRYLHARAFSRAGYQVDEAADGEQAWRSLRNARYDLLLTDQNMPCLTGLQLAARVREAGLEVPVIINSGCSDLGCTADYPQLGLAAIVEKSSDCTELLESVNALFARSAHSFSWPREPEQQRTPGWLCVTTSLG